MKFLIDGYNVIRTFPRYRYQKFTDEKKAILELLKLHPLIKNHKNETTVVFDGYNDFKNPVISYDIKIIFSESETADEIIKQIVENSKKPQDIYVVTDDREIKGFIRIMGAKHISIKEFAESVFPRQQSSINSLDTEKNIDTSDAIKITKELDKIWHD
ncbi:MAG: NYN domain-containing protein [Candidatus Firestonebacteria bacterium]|nr:NYN domain-containing protein [Candidatus Firestonebacteria bacterium]